MTTNNFWDRDVNVTLHIKDVDYILWTLWQDIEEILDTCGSPEEIAEIDRIQRMIDSIRSQAGYPEEVA